ncbi:Arc family DNA-binding protein [Elusimicrobiota bacterium]
MSKEEPKKRGRKPRWPGQKDLTVGFRLPQPIHDALRKSAKVGFRSMNQELVRILAEYYKIKPKS